MKPFNVLALLLVLALSALQVLAQAVSNVQGTIDSVMIDDGYIVIDGRQLPIRPADLVITYKGEPIRASFLDAGLSVFYSTRSDGSVSEITLVGPVTVLEGFSKQ